MHETQISIATHTGCGTQACVRVLTLSVWERVYKKKIIGFFRFKVMNSSIYSIEREVIKEFESRVSNLAFALCFHETYEDSLN